MYIKFISIAVLSGLLSIAQADNHATAHTPIKVNTNLTITAKTLSQSNQESRYTIDGVYPQISGTNLNSAAQEFNQKISDMITNAVTQFTMQIANPSVQMPAEMNKNTMNVDYKIYTTQANNQTIISVRFFELSYFAGASHPIHTLSTFNFNLTTGKQIGLPDLFKSGSNYLDIISSYCNKQLKAKIEEPDTTLIDQGTQPDITNFNNWTLSNDGILISFNEYQVASYASGMPEVMIPYKALQPVINPDALIAACANNPNGCK